MVGKVFDRMDSVRAVATKTELKIIDGIKQIDKNTLIYLSITELSGLVDVAEATILRFCRKLGYNGFQDFKLHLSQEIGSEPIDSGNTAKRIADDMTDAITETCKQIDYDFCIEIAREIVHARKVCAFAVGNSWIAASEMCYSLLRAGINVEVYSDSHIQTIAAANLNERDFVVLISASGSTKDIISIAEIVQRGRAKVLAITNYSKSPLVKYADYLLFSSRKEAAHDGGSLSTTVAQTYVVDVLCSAVREVLGSEGTEHRMKSSDAVSDKSY